MIDFNATELIFHTTKWSFLVHSTTRNASYIQPSHDSILELWRTFPNVYAGCTRHFVSLAMHLLIHIFFYSTVLTDSHHQ